MEGHSQEHEADGDIAPGHEEVDAGVGDEGLARISGRYLRLAQRPLAQNAGR